MATRRQFIGQMSLFALAMSTHSFAAKEKSGASTAHTAPDFPVPKGACDCHVHCIGPRDKFPLIPDRAYTPDIAPVEDLKRHLEVLRLDRVVIVNPSFYGTSNSSTLYGIRRLGKRARGVAVVAENVKHSELEELHRQGIRGVRLNVETGGTSDPQVLITQLRRAADAVAPLKWHVQIYTNLAMITALRDVIPTLPAPVVFDHFGSLKANRGLQQPGLPLLLDLMKSGKVYVKLSAQYRISELPGYTDAAAVVEAMVSANPDRVLWGSDWPHTFPGPGKTRPGHGAIEHFWHEDDGLALNRMARWVPQPDRLKKLLVDNPERLYFF
ncbi:MAG: amidohydrolase family protein [Candidatus Korobacteraceae bacterium]|jgi:predicted TIM-barrel fold metal-dependent hydrolase